MVEIDHLTSMNLVELRAEWRRLFGDAAPRLSAEMTRRALAYRLQERQQGRLTPAVRRRLLAVGSGSNIDTAPSAKITKPGTRLLREWNGRTYSVLSTPTGYEYDGRTFNSLSPIAREITGARWSGPRFFGLTGKEGAAQ